MVAGPSPGAGFGREFEEKIAAELGAGSAIGKSKKELQDVGKNLALEQQWRLRQFLTDQTLPKGFFDSSPPGLSVGQRLVLSAYMIAHGEVGKAGTTRPRSAPQAKNDRDLLRFSYNYAGLAPEHYQVVGTGPADAEGLDSVRRSLQDPTGRISFGSGRQESITVGDGLLSPHLKTTLMLI